jgi:hypothetical protein
MWVVNSYMLLELLKGVVRPLGECVETSVEVTVRHMPVGHERGLRHGVVGGEPVKRIGHHLD